MTLFSILIACVVFYLFIKVSDFIFAILSENAIIATIVFGVIIYLTYYK